MNFDSISLFDLASKRLDYLAERQQVISENIANADTPGFRAQDVAPFEELLDHTTSQVSLETTHTGHKTGGGTYETVAVTNDDRAWEQSINGNTVVLEQQTIKAAEIEDGYQLAADLYRKAHQLLTLATTGRK
ncbi:Flagellar basal body rod protein FlgB [Roseivivax sp. THAF40]|uniref:flagellar basal body rod protein FlgB n=1 Tax=Roseivivax sp. THAF40 TaxID=2587858 RepID=UPI001267DFF3|nr:flagellar basal body rod protein FlgB [Roseivivax sp. THAF40]QFT47366.1 Flagellar basal body rod protein FlgB [Roseivivax sp. THAF40]